MVRWITRTLAAALAVASLSVGSASAQDWPQRPITIVVGFNPGGSVDRLARGLAPHLAEELGQPVNVENRPGAGGQVGTTWFLQQPADGHTLMVTPATPYLPTNILVTNAKYSMEDFSFINAQWRDFAFLAVAKDKPYQTFEDLAKAIKAEPGKISAGVTFGSIGHVLTLVMLESLGLPEDAVRLVTFDGGGPLRTAIAGGHVDFSIVQAEGSETIADMIRPLTVFLDEPREDFDAPLIADAMKPFGATMPALSGSVRTLVAPAKFKEEHPEDYKRLVEAYRKALEKPEFQKWLAENQMGGDWVGPEKTTKLIMDNFEALKRYRHLLKD